MKKIWINNYEQGVATDANVAQYSSIPDVFLHSVERFSSRVAYRNFGTSLTFYQTGLLTKYFASFLQNHLQVKRGERIAIMMPNVLQYPVAIFGALRAGMVVVNVNPLYTPRELAYQLNNSGATTIIILENFANTLSSIIEQTQIKNIIIARIGDLLGSIKGRVINFAVRYIKKMIAEYNLPNTISFNRAIELGKQKPFVEVALSLDDLAMLQYTGGTTGTAKGAMLTHGNICANMAQAREWIKNKLIFGEETFVTPLPLYHIFSLTVNLMIACNVGATNVLITNPRDIKSFIKILRHTKTTVITGVNTLFNALLDNPDFAKIDFSTWKLSLSGGMATQKSVAKQWYKITGLPLIEAYGLTECSPGVCVNPLNITEYTGDIGLPIPNTEVQIRDNDGCEVPIGEVGELWVKGPQVMKGYWQTDEETAKVFDKDGWLSTGDICTMDNRGFIRLIDRKKDIIVISGFNVYPNEIEEIVANMEGVREVACIGTLNEKNNEAIKIFVVRNNPSKLTKEEIISYCKKQLTAYKVPKIIEFCDELPKSNVGKVLRQKLRDQ
ncbi:MAG: AMP-binding protein [Neisseriaceae bacterium]|nr:AMP-binding protein [Neisseriaceae bacterium]